MRTKFYLVPLLAAITANAMADSDGPGCRRDWLTGKLGLEEPQIAPVEKILTHAREQHRAVMEKQMEAARPEMEAVEVQARTELSGILNAEQLTKYDKFVEKRKSRHEQRGGGPAPWGGHRHGKEW